MKLSPINLALLPFLSAFSASAAVYQVVDLGEVVDARATYATSVNDQGVAILNGQQLYSVDIDISTIDFDDAALKARLTEEQLEALKGGELTAETHAILYMFSFEWPGLFERRYTTRESQVSNLVERYSFQPVTVTAAFITKGQGVEPLRFRTTETEIGNNEMVLGQNRHNTQVGFATPPFEYIQFTKQDDPELLPEDAEISEPSEHWIWRPDGAQRLGVVRVDDTTLTLNPIYTEFGGGSSLAQAINDEGLIIGVGSVESVPDFADLIDKYCKGLTAPIENCLHYWHQQGNFYIERAMVWQLLPDKSISEPVVLGFLGDKGSNEPHPDTDLPSVVYQSRAMGLNNAGIIVGQSTYSDSSDIVVTERLDYSFYPPRPFEVRNLYNSMRASIFMDDQVLPVFPANDREWRQSVATAINNHNVVVGYAMPTRAISGQFPRRMFYYDMTTDKMVFPEDLFISANTQPRAINDLGIIVGHTQAIVASVKRQRAFMYDIADGSFIDLNTYLACDTGYTLVDATSINNSNEILATAVTEVPLRNSFGEVLLDDDGNPLTEFQARAVKLTPIANGTPSHCGTEDELIYERKSASGSLWSAFGLSLLVLWRRKVARTRKLN